jgi:hypothetical protein
MLFILEKVFIEIAKFLHEAFKTTNLSFNGRQPKDVNSFARKNLNPILNELK